MKIIMKFFLLISVSVVLLIGINTYNSVAADIEAVLDTADGTSSLSVKDSGNVEVARINSNGNIQSDGSLKIDGTGDSYIMGKVGIGMTSPIAQFHMIGLLRVDNNITSQKGVWLQYKDSVSATTLSSFDNVNTVFLPLLINSLATGTDGYVGIRRNSASYPLHMGSGAYVTTGGIWTDASSRAYKENIKKLTTEEAIYALEELNPVKFNYKKDKKERHVGFIAEDVPALVATPDRKGLSPMDIVAVLTRVVQEQQKTISELSKKVDMLEKNSDKDYKSLARN